MKLMKITITIIIILGVAYFLSKWVIGDLISTPISEFTLKDMGSIILSIFIWVFASKFIAQFIREYDSITRD